MAGSGIAHMRNSTDVVLTVRDLVVEFRLSKDRVVKAVSGLSFDVIKGEVLAIVGESGCGKTTLGRAILQLPPPNSGEVIFEGTDLTQLPKENLRSARTAIQMIFQDPISSLDPRMTVKQLIDEPLEIWQRGDEQERSVRINELLNNVGLDSELVLDRHAYEFSGGQCQRISIARALALDPRMLICDEPVSALDVSIQAQIINLLQDMHDRYGLSIIFISHDLAVVKAISNRVMVMYLGKICEVAPPEILYAKPAHHYTRALLNSVPIPDPTRQTRTELLQGEPPSPMNPPTGCRFRTRCAAASVLCTQQEPQLREVSPGQFVACHHPII
ncbi:MAG: ATP-binding cassette domain-containing protein [Ilumatobacteraceae bacterium]|nr:ATP-binding cassette domain-containing protein [Ilumatobacteraceae bacterium]